MGRSSQHEDGGLVLVGGGGGAKSGGGAVLFVCLFVSFAVDGAVHQHWLKGAGVGVSGGTCSASDVFFIPSSTLAGRARLRTERRAPTPDY